MYIYIPKQFEASEQRIHYKSESIKRCHLEILHAILPFSVEISSSGDESKFHYATSGPKDRIEGEPASFPNYKWSKILSIGSK